MSLDGLRRTKPLFRRGHVRMVIGFFRVLCLDLSDLCCLYHATRILMSRDSIGHRLLAKFYALREEISSPVFFSFVRLKYYVHLCLRVNSLGIYHPSFIFICCEGLFVVTFTRSSRLLQFHNFNIVHGLVGWVANKRERVRFSGDQFLILHHPSSHRFPIKLSTTPSSVHHWEVLH